MFKLNGVLVQGAMSGYSDAEFCKKAAIAGASMVTLGGYNVDLPTSRAGMRMKQKGRHEFYSKYPQVLDYVKEEIEKLAKVDTKINVNVRCAEIGTFKKAVNIIKDAGADMIEINAHCRQTEMTTVGGGEFLLQHPRKLQRLVKIAKRSKLPVSVKIRTNVVNDIQLAKELASYNIDIIHVDAMLPKMPRADLRAITKIQTQVKIPIIGNNSVKNGHDVRKMLKAGANYVSVARAIKDDPEIIYRIKEEYEEYKK